MHEEVRLAGTPPKERWIFDRCAGHVALDFANTVSRRHTETPIERLPSYAELVSFAEQTELLDRPGARRLVAWAHTHAREAAAILRRAVALRDALFDVFVAAVRGERPLRTDLAVFNEAMSRVHLGQELAWEWADGPEAPDALLAPIVRSAADLLTGDGRERVRLCEAPDCVWLFVDTSKNRTRRWCDMKQCGNRMKARRFYERHQRHHDA